MLDETIIVCCLLDDGILQVKFSMLDNTTKLLTKGYRICYIHASIILQSIIHLDGLGVIILYSMILKCIL